MSPEFTAPVFIFALIAPFFAIAISMPGLVTLGLPTVSLLYLAKIENKIVWVLVGAFIGQASYQLFVPDLMPGKVGSINPFLAMPAVIGILTGLKANKRLYRDKSSIEQNSDEPTFKSIFGASWNDLPPVMKKHYANHPYCEEVTTVEGTLDVMCAGPLKLLAPLMNLMGQVPAYNEKAVPVTVEFKSDKASKAFHFVRTFNFKNAKPYIFHSRMLQIKDNEVIEIMRFRVGWKMLFAWDGEKVTLTHRGYVLHLFGLFIPLPLTLLMGKGYAEETALDGNTFDMITHITHPWWGKVYEYKGRFEVI